MTTFYVTYKVESRYIASVEADCKETALKEAENKFQDADFGDAEDIEGEAIIIEDEDGNYVWEK